MEIITNYLTELVVASVFINDVQISCRHRKIDIRNVGKNVYLIAEGESWFHVDFRIVEEES